MSDVKQFTLEDKLARTGARMTAPRRVLARVLGAASDHPDVEELHRRAQEIDPGISLATVYRTVRLFEQLGIEGASREMKGRQVLWGGPVQVDRGFVLHDDPRPWSSTLRASVWARPTPRPSSTTTSPGRGPSRLTRS